MKQSIFLILSIVLFFTSCSDDNDNAYKTFPVTVQLTYPSDSELTAVEGVAVKLTGSSGTTYDAVTDANGKADFTVPIGIYEASASEQRALDGYSYILNGIKSGITVTDTWTGEDVVDVTLTESKSGQVIIKELYVGGCSKDDGSGNYQFDKYVILYNNSAQTATLENFCLGIANPANSYSGTNDYVDGVLSYANDNYIPAGCAIWYLPTDLAIESGKQVVIALNGAINHTLTYSNSVDLSHADYCTYDIEDFSHTSYYPSPSEAIPTSHYFSAYKYGSGTGWTLSNNSPAFFIFSPRDVTPEAFASNPDYHYIGSGNEGKAAWRCAKVPTDWILDGIEIYSEANVAKSHKRLTPVIDAGYTLLTNYQGHTSYRNVDKEATEAIEGNSDKLVYGYAYGTDGSTDPSGIDAEASIKNGARIIYMDTNNSTNDFHQRSQSSLRD
ncbi:MAG: DUF4876 domain-containing protein [Bacteroides sp.]|jgi:hypothetical protein|nr:DUF4876 domain-containing protein [Bacteroides sp.]